MARARVLGLVRRRVRALSGIRPAAAGRSQAHPEGMDDAGTFDGLGDVARDPLHPILCGDNTDRIFDAFDREGPVGQEERCFARQLLETAQGARKAGIRVPILKEKDNRDGQTFDPRRTVGVLEGAQKMVAHAGRGGIGRAGPTPSFVSKDLG